ncbi:AAA family ATPase [Bythopirellula goksoeyrii]|uniref:Flagellum site-determining protein YlxH n=1 Tax=Bythopirellula goksoeyrii TaxID=1400387 RepID=A0A5B9Q251_9BACT|nr:AAA family ATPase [Bythopirellula goksoeyrii]QEG33068.1 Flagellum site-determining protein YlxH [Bythopirellula goksoeyrii]
MLDQADKLRMLVRETVKEHAILQPGIPLVAVSGAQRGVGATTVAQYLAQELAQLGKRVVLVDANLLAPRLTASMKPSRSGSLSEVLNGHRSVAEVLEQIGEGIQLLSGIDVDGEVPEMNLRALKRLLTDLRSLRNDADIILIDTGEGMTPWIEKFWTAALQILLVTTVQSSSVMDSYAAVKLAPWGDVDGKLRLVVNQCNDVDLGMRASDSFASTCRRFLGMRLLGDAAVLASDKQLHAGAETLSHRSPLRRSVRLLAADLLSQAYLIQGRNTQPRSKSLPSESQAASLFTETEQRVSIAASR